MDAEGRAEMECGGGKKGRVEREPHHRKQRHPPANVQRLDAGVPVPEARAVGPRHGDPLSLAGSHTLGLARCTTFKPRIYNHTGTLRADPEFGRELLVRSRIHCPRFGHGNQTLALDYQSPHRFDNYYFRNLLARKALLNSDQVLTYQSPLTRALVTKYAYDQPTFFAHFAASMLRMGGIRPLTGAAGQVRRSCRAINRVR
ncbi:peroxidase 15-like [Selaginella moellendorffii]|uniref:peroxidase 15-like n=1 Tax=Selaginella moellendorffii TaxID=88036 RepID=UPI000D1C8843|nr:peroxidase 15-like [Selaginella moellendorffii]|eukprot:XP_024531278.1 peroxidase 15-like [Selaginella moellendorffii]